jgi:hypothetical protein
MIRSSRKLHNKELLNFYFSLSIIRIIKSRRMRLQRDIVQHAWETKRNAYMTLVGEPERNRPLGRLRCRRKGNIKSDLKDVEWGVMDWIHLVQGRDQSSALVNTVLDLQDA